jgi:hypothetical protein
MNRIENQLNVGRRRTIDTARRSFDPSLPRRGRVILQCERAFAVGDGRASMRELRQWCFAGKRREHWHYADIYSALRRLGAERIGWGI